MKRSSRYTLWNFVLDFTLTVLTAGFWLIWMLIRELQNFHK